MKKSITVNLMENTLIISKAFYKKASCVGSAEYYELRKAMAENKGFDIEFKSCEKKTYKKLTLEAMANYIRTQPNSQKRLIEFATVQAIAETKGAKYPLTKKWFLNTFPEYKENEVKQNETETLIAELTKNLAEGKIEELTKFAPILASASNQ